MVDVARGVAVVLLNYRGAADTLACVDSLLAHGRLFDRLVICDNASPDDSWLRLCDGLAQREPALADARQRACLATRELWATARRDQLPAAHLDAWVLLIDNQANLGFAAGNNVGLRVVQSDPQIGYFWLLNNDTELPTQSLQALLDAAAERPEIDLWGCTVVYHAQPGQVQALGGGHMHPRTAETRHIGAFRPVTKLRGDAAEVAEVEAEMDYALGASMLATRRWLDQVGLLGEDYFLYYEELDWALRGRRAGMRIGYAPAAVVLHKEGASIGTAPGGGSPLSVYHLNRSRGIFVRKHFGMQMWVLASARAVWQATKLLLRLRWPQGKAAMQGLIAGVWSQRSGGQL